MPGGMTAVDKAWLDEASDACSFIDQNPLLAGTVQCYLGSALKSDDRALRISPSGSHLGDSRAAVGKAREVLFEWLMARDFQPQDDLYIRLGPAFRMLWRVEPPERSMYGYVVAAYLTVTERDAG